MADPTTYGRSYSQAGFQQANPGDPLPGLQVDVEFDAVAVSIGQLVSAIKDVRRSDGALKNGIVTADSLAPDVANTLSLLATALALLSTTPAPPSGPSAPDFTNLPTTDPGVLGTVWNNGGFVSVSLGGSSSVGGGSTSSSDALSNLLNDLPTSMPTSSGVWWNNNGTFARTL